MNKKWKTIILNYVLTPLGAALILSLWFFTVKGIPLGGLPDLEDVALVEITDKRVGITVRIEEEGEAMKTAVNLPGFLKYSFGKPEEEELFITITYYLKNDKVMTVKAGKTSVLWNGKARKIQRDNGSMFLKIVEGYYFSDQHLE